MKKSLSIEEFLETRPDITPEMLEEGRLLVEAKIKGSRPNCPVSR